jgi:uncharacterized membrane protein
MILPAARAARCEKLLAKRQVCRDEDVMNFPIHKYGRIRRIMGAHRVVGAAAVITALGVMMGLATPALADLKLCNMTSSRIGVAIGYKDQQGWVSEGWWNVGPQSCEVLLKGALIARYYYVHAVDYDRGGEWSGTDFMCSDDKAFTIRGVTDCEQRGYRRLGFFEVDTKEETDWTIRMTDSTERGTE